MTASCWCYTIYYRRLLWSYNLERSENMWYSERILWDFSKFRSGVQGRSSRKSCYPM